MPQPREKHFHLVGGRILRFVEYHKAIAERAPAHECQWSNFDLVLRPQLLHLVIGQHVAQSVVERPEVGVHLLGQVSRQKS